MAYWLDVLRHFEEKKYFRNGLTIPFLIGSRTVLEPDEPIESIEEFITEISESDPPITLMKCGTLREYVLSIIDSYDIEMMKVHKNLYKRFGNLIIIDDSFANFTSLSEIISNLNTDLSDEIEAVNYSKMDGEWSPFSEKDLKRINEILGHNENKFS